MTINEILSVLHKCSNIDDIARKLGRAGIIVEPDSTSILAQSHLIDSGCLSKLTDDGLGYANRWIKHLLEGVGEAPLRRFLAVDRFCQLYLNDPDTMEYGEAVARALSAVNALESLSEQRYCDSVVQRYESIRSDDAFNWMQIERDILATVFQVWQQQNGAVQSRLTLPMLMDFLQPQGYQGMLDLDDPYETKRYRSLLSDINNGDCAENVWDFGLRLMANLTRVSGEQLKRFRRTLYNRLHSGVRRFLRHLEDDMAEGLAYFLKHNMPEPPPQQQREQLQAVRDLIRRKAYHKVRLLSREGYHSVSSRFDNSRFVLIATQVRGNGHDAKLYMLLLPRSHGNLVQYLERHLIDGHLRPYEVEFLRLQDSVVQEELIAETARRRRAKLSANLGRCITLGVSTGILLAVPGGVLGGLFTSFSLPFAVVTGLLSGTIAFGVLRYRIAHSLQLQSLSAAEYAHVENIPRMLMGTTNKVQELACPAFVPLIS